jgi:DNA-binding response OmpR family regulator
MHTSVIIFLVEDDERLSHSLSFTLRRLGYSVETSNNGIAALEKVHDAYLRGNVPSLIISDIQLPGMDGIQLIQGIRHISPDVPILVITGNCTRETRDTLATFGVTSILDKPFDMEDLIAEIIKLV